MCSDCILCHLPVQPAHVTLVAAVLIAGEYLTQGCTSITKLTQPPLKGVVACHTHRVIVLLCKLEMSHMEEDWKVLSTMKPPLAL